LPSRCFRSRQRRKGRDARFVLGNLKGIHGCTDDCANKCPSVYGHLEQRKYDVL
jgi:hypothetical protein